MAKKKPKAPVHSAEHMLREQGVAPVWLAQINELWKDGIYEQTVRLPGVDMRQPLAKPEAQERSLLPPTSNAKNPTTSFTSSSSQSQSQPQQQQQPPQVNVNLPSSSHERDTHQEHIVTGPRRSHISPSTRGRLGHVRPSSNKSEHALMTRTLKPQPSRRSRGRGDPRNTAMRQAKLRYEQEKLAIEQQDQQEPVDRIDVVSENSPHGFGRASPVANMTRTQPINLSSQQCLVQQPARNASTGGRFQPLENPSRLYGLRPAKGRNRNVYPRPLTSAHRPNSAHHSQQQPNDSIVRRQGGWCSWIELRVKIFGLPATVTTLDLWQCFSKEGTIDAIEIFENSQGAREGKASVRYRPPPAKPFWQRGQYPVKMNTGTIVNVRLELEPQKRSFLVPSPVSPQVKFPEVMTMNADSLDFGFMYDSKTMMCMHDVKSAPSIEILVRQNMLRREIAIQTQIYIQDGRAPLQDGRQVPKFGKYNRTETYQFRVPFSQLQPIHQIRTEGHHKVLLISLDTPPRFFRKVPEIDTHEEHARFWTQNDAWYRQTDIVYNPNRIRLSPLTLKKSEAVIDIGRWTTYRLVFDMTRNDEELFERVCHAFRDHNIDIVSFPDFKLITNREPAVWDYIDKPIVKQSRTNSALDDLIEDAVLLAFPVRYQLEVCISQGCLNEHNLSRNFVKQLMETEPVRAQDLLEYVANQNKRMYDPMEIFKMTIIKGSASRPKIPQYCAYTRSATVTPSTVYYNTPTVETSNRVVRQYAATHADRFLRVRFTDEKFEGRINPTDKDTSDEIFTRIKRTMINGITIGDRHYEFLAFGNSQFREHGAYFFAPTVDLSTEAIRGWMGMFRDIVIVAKHAARLGQCFSTTRAISGTKVNIVEIDDIKRNGKDFSDGVGKISELLARLVASELGVGHSPFGPPSVYQFRLGGCKGVLAVSPDAKKREIHIRESQYKFPAVHEGLEIIRWSQFASANLNRQLILVLSALGVSDNVFINKLKMQLIDLERAMNDKKMALSLLQKDVDANQMTLVLAAMVVDGFQSAREPFMTSLLQLWRAWSIKYLKEKARITVGDGALLFGCVDETATLKGHFSHIVPPSHDASIEEKTEALPEVFVQVCKSPDEKPQVILGPMLLARNPSLHPGDIRVVRGVDVPQLHHLRDVVVLPQTGDRDLAGMCSGGDLDGDDYLVIWDKELLPYEWNHEPMDYTPPVPFTVDREVTVDDITSFFVTYMKNDTLPRIAHAHVAFADFLDAGVKDEKCLRLAALHSMAVDYVKTGVPARMPRELAPKKWPHFMEKNHKPKEQIYVSHKILGKLYDQVERVDFIPAFSNTFDKRILQAYKLENDVLQDATSLKQEYDAAMRRIMAQHDIKTEFEVWSTFVLHHSNQSKDYKFHEEIGQLSSALKDQYRTECYRKAGSKDFHIMGPFVAAMYAATALEMDEAVNECRQVKIVGGVEMPVRKMTPESMPLMSFPWLFHDILGKIANGSFNQNTDAAMLMQREAKHTLPKKSRADHGLLDEEDTLETAEGVTHRGEVLELFDKFVHYGSDLYNGNLNTMSKPSLADFSGDKPSSEASVASVNSRFSMEFPPLPQQELQKHSSSGIGTDDLADVSANDNDIWSSTENGSGELINVYHDNDTAISSTEAGPHDNLLLDFEVEVATPAKATVQSGSSSNALAEMVEMKMETENMENKEEAEALALSRSESSTGTAENEAAKGAKNPTAMETLTMDINAPNTTSPSPNGAYVSASTKFSHQAKKPSNHNVEALLEFSEDEEVEEVVIEMDEHTSLLDRLAALNAS